MATRRAGEVSTRWGDSGRSCATWFTAARSTHLDRLLRRVVPAAGLLALLGLAPGCTATASVLRDHQLGAPVDSVALRGGAAVSFPVLGNLALPMPRPAPELSLGWDVTLTVVDDARPNAVDFRMLVPLGLSRMPLGHEGVVGYEALGLLGMSRHRVSGVAHSSFTFGGRLGVPVLLSATGSAWNEDHLLQRAFYLVPSLELSHSDEVTSVAGVVALRFRAWSSSLW